MLELYDIQNILKALQYAMDYCNNEYNEVSFFISVIDILEDKLSAHINKMEECQAEMS